MNRTQEYARVNNIQVSGISLRPYYNNEKRRVTKGGGMANEGWNKAPGFQHQYLKYYGNDTTAWFMDLTKMNLCVIDVDVKGDTTAKEALTEEAYNRLYEASSYVVETGSGGLHFYFQTKEKLTKKTDVEQWRTWFRPGAEGGIDLITDCIVIEGSSYSYEGKTHSYKSVKPGSTIEGVTFHQSVWDDILDVSKPRNIVVIPEDLPAGVAPIEKEAYHTRTEKIEEVTSLVDLFSEKRATDYTSWINVGLALKAVFHHMPEGEALFLRFSQKSQKYNETDCLKAYRSIVPRAGYTKRSLFYWAKEDNPEDYSELFGNKMNWGSLKGVNQNEMAKCFTDVVKQEFVFSSGVWFRYTENNTLVPLGKTHPDGLKRLVSDTLQTELHKLVVALKNDDELKSACMKLAGECHRTFGSSQWVNGVIDFVRGLYTDDDLFDTIDTNTNLLAFSNGLLFDYSTKSVRPIQREDNISRTTKMPLTQESSAENRAFLLKELLNIFDDPQVVRYWLETISQALFTNRYEKLYCHTGSGGNGKGVLFGMLKEGLGSYYYQAPNEFLTTTYRADAPNSVLANARGVRILMTSEPSSQNSDGRGMKIGTDLIKALSGCDPINARDLYESAKNPYKPTFTCFLQVNILPDFTKVDGALRRRFEKLDYPNKFVEEPKRKNEKKADYDLKRKLCEYPIVNEFMLLLWETAVGFTGFHRPASVKESTKSFLDDADKVLCWLEEKMEKTDELPEKEHRITKAGAVKMFLTDTGTRISPKAFHDQMRVNEVEMKKISVEYYLIKRLPEPEEDKPEEKSAFRL